MTQSGLWKGVAKYALGIFLLGLVLFLNWNGLMKLFQRTPQFEPFLLGAAILVSITMLQYVRWYLLVRAVGLPFTFRNALRLGLVGTFYNTFLPGSIGGDFVKAFFIAKDHPEQKPTAIATVVADRLVGLFGLLLFGAVVGGGFWASGEEKIVANPKLQTIVIVCITLSAAAIVGYFGLGIVSAGGEKRIAERLHVIRKVGPTLAEVWYTVWTYRQRPGTVLAVVLLSAVVHSGMVFIFHLAVQVFPPESADQLGTMPEHFIIAPIGYIVQALIPVPGGLGGGELTFGGLYNLIRPGAAEVGLAGRLSMRLMEWAIGLVGYIAYLQMRTELPVQAAEEASEDADPYGTP